ncbi:MAG: hypothetical protein AB7D36_03080 [Oscillospiraceae bacterium]
MSLFAKRPVALLCALAVVVTSTAAGAKLSMEKDSRDIEEMFYSGVEYDGYVHKSIYSQITQRSDAANGLLSIAKNYGLDTEYTALKTARDNLDYTSGITFYYYSDQELATAFDNLREALSNCDLSERDAEAVENYASIFSNAGNVIDNAGYNEAVREFYRDDVYTFPAEFFYDNLSIDTPDYYGTMWY